MMFGCASKEYRIVVQHLKVSIQIPHLGIFKTSPPNDFESRTPIGAVGFG